MYKKRFKIKSLSPAVTPVHVCALSPLILTLCKKVLRDKSPTSRYIDFCTDLLSLKFTSIEFVCRLLWSCLLSFFLEFAIHQCQNVIYFNTHCYNLFVQKPCYFCLLYLSTEFLDKGEKSSCSI